MESTDLSKRMKFLLYHFDMNQKEMADKLGVSQSVISSIVNKERINLSSKFVEQLALQFNVNCNWFILGKGELLLNEDNL